MVKLPVIPGHEIGGFVNWKESRKIFRPNGLYRKSLYQLRALLFPPQQASNAVGLIKRWVFSDGAMCEYITVHGKVITDNELSPLDFSPVNDE